MSRAEVAGDSVYVACIAWNVEAIRRSGLSDAAEFVNVMSLLPSALAPPRGDPVPSRMSPLRRAVEGLKLELRGDAESAKKHYLAVAKHPGVRGLLGLLLLAWTNDATEADFERASRRIDQLRGRGSRGLAATCHCKLSGWAMDHGWRERAILHYDVARRLAGENLRRTLEGVGQWFHRDQVLYFGGTLRKVTDFPFIREQIGYAASKALEERLKRSYRSPWTLTWSIGPSVEGLGIQVAELQASWAGAIWMMPAIQRQHCALILENSRQPDDVARAIGLWVRGGGDSPGKLVEFNEGYLTAESVRALLETQLAQGQSVYFRSSWLETCQSLWDQMPSELVESLVTGYRGPPANLDPYSDEAKELELFAWLLARYGAAPPAVHKFSQMQLAFLARLLTHSSAAALPGEVLEMLLAAVITTATEVSADWRGIGWTKIAHLWSRLSAEQRERWRESLIEAAPATTFPELAASQPGLVPARVLRDALKQLTSQVAEEVTNAANGHYIGWARSPVVAVARVMRGLRQARPAAVSAIVSVATSKYTSSEQRYGALRALQSLAEDGLLDLSQVESAFPSVPVYEPLAGDTHADQRLEDMARLALRVRLDTSEDWTQRLLTGARDSDRRVREVAVGSARWRSLSAAPATAAQDATLLGALYDPHPEVQALAVEAILRGTFADAALQQVARARLMEAWPQAHRTLRVAIAMGVGADPRQNDSIADMLSQLASRDRSWIVRTSIVIDQN